MPSLAIKTGYSKKDCLGSSSSVALDVVSARAQSGTPVLALDVRNRLPLELPLEKPPGSNGSGRRGSVVLGKQRRAALIEQAKAQIDEWRGKLLEEREGKPRKPTRL